MIKKLKFAPILFVLLMGLANGQDRGKEEVAQVRVVMLFGSNRDLQEVVPEAKEASKEHARRVGQLKNLKFSNYASLGEDTKPVWRSYTNWAAPMAGHDEILLSFEPSDEASSSGLSLDLELWQEKRKVMKVTQRLQSKKWLYIAGPEWRGGRLILAVELVGLQE